MGGARYAAADGARMLEEFGRHVIGHPSIVSVRDQVMSLVRLRADVAACLVVGPTGVGKSTMVSRLVTAVEEEAAASGDADPTRAGHVLFSAPPALNGSFSVAEFLTRGLLALQDPGTLAGLGSSPRPTSWRGHRSVGELQRAFERAVRERRPLAVIVDEAGHLARVGGGERLISQLDLIKALADATGALFVFVGTYDLAALRNANGQLARRLHDIHFPRYGTDARGAREFSVAMRSLVHGLPVPGDGLVDDPAFLYRGSLGCVGVAKNWLSRALKAAIDGHDAAVTAEHLRRTRLPDDKLLQIAREIAEGERAMAGDAGAAAMLDELLGLAPQPPSPAPRRPGRRRPGTRSTAARDLVGARP